MKSNYKMKWIFVVILLAFLAGGGLMARASPPDDKEVVEQPGEEPTASNSGGVAASVSGSVSSPRAVQRVAIDGELIGTAVVEGGTSYALFQSANGTRLVREGDEIARGVRLVQVRKNRIDVERKGVREEIRIGWSEGAGQQVRSGSNPAGSGVEKRARLMEDLRARGRL